MENVPDWDRIINAAYTIELWQARNWNRMVVCGPTGQRPGAQLQVLPRPGFAEMPPNIFPKTVGGILYLTHDNLKELLELYGQPTEGDQSALMAQFLAYCIQLDGHGPVVAPALHSAPPPL
ncbi:uncharacterized protein FOMMEDRAFT_161971 [Fomitiporia mediterranea MF3/22]|uniref:uncharacterized protein n=1 Tax=Fomitiporia mediterranea (strain MF3/22) TaxID=694068 RepID=UPI0004407D42|nr:uncharacterized protein FOMMEDRAFT_161971 [Fomitiporia mediterranea MF3/22]EJC98215.1 hypothetical protein FOMMEDRAFT_161971 [Fomitiporia mediterranea MF3/22]